MAAYTNILRLVLLQMGSSSMTLLSEVEQMQGVMLACRVGVVDEKKSLVFL
ncbi:hypothetical protein [Treponema sp.]|uniref:hypothetical protein n=1 Tax=Treponema sp. TaxID=166 RepID=UPI003FA2A7E9